MALFVSSKEASVANCQTHDIRGWDSRHEIEGTLDRSSFLPPETRKSRNSYTKEKESISSTKKVVTKSISE